MTPYERAKVARDAIEAECKRAGAALRALSGGGPMNLTPDHVKASPEWQTANARNNAAFAALQRFNRSFVKTFAREIRAERRAR